MWSRFKRFAWSSNEKKTIVIVACCEGIVLIVAFLVGLWFFLRT